MMPVPTLDFFVQGLGDVEATQYRLLNYVQHIRTAFARNIIYPHLAQLVELHTSLSRFVAQATGLRDSLPSAEAEEGLLPPAVDRLSDPGHVDTLIDLVEWALPIIQDALEEGRTIFEFVDEHLRIEEVGILPSYVEEGYLLVPDRDAEHLHVLQYQLSIFARADEQYRSLRTVHLKSMPCGGVMPAPQAIKMSLIEERGDLPNPATFLMDSQLAFPYRETVLPVAKRKLMQHLFVGLG